MLKDERVGELYGIWSNKLTSHTVGRWNPPLAGFSRWLKCVPFVSLSRDCSPTLMQHVIASILTLSIIKLVALMGLEPKFHHLWMRLNRLDDGATQRGRPFEYGILYIAFGSDPILQHNNPNIVLSQGCTLL